MPARVSPLLDGTVTGRFSLENPGELLELLAAAQHFNWYFDSGIVYFFSESEMVSRLISLGGVSEDALRGTLTSLGLFEPRFTWKVADSGQLLMVQGPEVYLTRILDVLSRLAETQKDAAEESTYNTLGEDPQIRKLGVFRLKHAWAAERTITSGDSDVTIPGVADLLRQILAGGMGPSASEIRRSPTPPGMPRLNKGTGLMGRDKQAAEQAAVPTEPVADNVPFIKADARLNAVLVWDTEDNLTRYREIVETLDQPLELVEIRAAIVDVEVDRTRELGVTWEYDGKNGNWEHNAGSNVGEGSGRVDYNSIAGDGFQYATIFSKGLDHFMARVSALVKVGEANVLSRPSVLTQENIQATLEHTETFYVRLEGEREVDLADITTGLTLRVTPHVVHEEDGCYAIQLAVYIVNGTDDYDTDSRVDNLPRVRQSTISTNAVVYEGEALVIGGYYNEIRQTSERGVPGLRKIPGLGALFRSRGATGSKSERLFVLSPRLVRPGESPISPGSEAERGIHESPAATMLQGPALADPARPERLNRMKITRDDFRPKKDGVWTDLKF